MSESPYTTTEERGSYGVGLQLGDQLRANPFEGMDIEIVCAGLKDAFADRPSVVSQGHMEDAFAIIRAKIEKDEAEKASKLSVEGEAFLAENAKKDGIQVTESGLQYEIITAGEGDKPSLTSTVKTHYHGTLISGDVFDSSVQRNQPAEFPVNGVIAGWTEALQMMPVGSKWRLFVPYQLAYGERGAGGAIGPYAALIFEVELLEIVG
jgi:FKBP-type peptidyl-prolyl cis-trans isomerase FklB